MRKRAASVFLSLVLGTTAISAQSVQSSLVEEPTVSLTMVAVRDTVKPGSPVVVRVMTKNISNKPVNRSHFRDAIYNFVIFVKDTAGNPAPETEEFQRINKLRKQGEVSASIVLGHPLKPGETAEESIDIAEYYDLTRPGQYTIQAQQGPLKTNIVTVTVTP
jgi:hypothetical protein